MPFTLVGTDDKPITQHDLSLDIVNERNKNYIHIPFPEHYPHTSFHKYQLKHEGLLAKMMFSFPYHIPNTIFIHQLYVYTHDSLSKGKASAEEKALTKGLGPTMLCKAVHYAIATEMITPDGFIQLEASGGSCHKKMRRLISNPEWRHEGYTLDQYIERFGLMIEEDKEHAVCSHIENQILVHYYKGYGLEPMEIPHGKVDPYSTPMRGPITSVLRICDRSRYGTRYKRIPTNKSIRKNRNISRKRQKTCTCWKGYERVLGTIPCAKNSCRKSRVQSRFR